MRVGILITQMKLLFKLRLRLTQPIYGRPMRWYLSFIRLLNRAQNADIPAPTMFSLVRSLKLQQANQLSNIIVSDSLILFISFQYILEAGNLWAIVECSSLHTITSVHLILFFN